MSGKNNIEKLDLTKILKNCPKGWKFYTSVWGEVEFIGFSSESVDFLFNTIVGTIVDVHININGTYCGFGECIIFPSKEQRDWSKFTAPWYKTERFDPKTLKPFDRVLVRNFKAYKWKCEHFSYFNEGNDYPCKCTSNSYSFCVPYNDETKYLVGTSDEAPKYYRYWEDNYKQK